MQAIEIIGLSQLRRTRLVTFITTNVTFMRSLVSSDSQTTVC